MPLLAKNDGLGVGRIVVATDFTPKSDKALAFARDLYHHFASKITVAHVVDLPVATSSEDAVIGFDIAAKDRGGISDVRRKLLEAVSSIQKIISNANIAWCRQKFFVEFDDITERIIKVAADVHVDLIVLDADLGANRHSRFIQGLVEYVVANAACPVMTVETA